MYKFQLISIFLITLYSIKLSRAESLMESLQDLELPVDSRQARTIYFHGPRLSIVPLGCLLFNLFCPDGHRPGHPGPGGYLPPAPMPAPWPGQDGYNPGGSQDLVNLNRCDPKMAPTQQLISGKDFNMDALLAHNHYRQLHHAHPIKIDASLNMMAQAYAVKLAAGSPFTHSPDSTSGRYGENLAKLTGINLSGNAPVDEWYCEIDNFDFNNPTLSPSNGRMVGHFTAIVWKNVTMMGIGKAEANGYTYVVTNYLPPPNNPDPNMIKQNVSPKA